MTDSTDTLCLLRERLAAFAADRDWDQFHNPKNIVMALAVEAAELMEHFQWLTPEQAEAIPDEVRSQIALEAADVLLYLVRLCDKLQIDLSGAAVTKLALNEHKYPVEKARGKATKYDKL
jgi:NTP pyrophosphatase (non-canonical NTP hydrolase)